MAKDEKRGNLRDAVHFIKRKGDKGSTVPDVAEAFGRTQSTADNWLRTAEARGFLRRTKPEAGTSEGAMDGKAGRPPCTYTITAKGSKWTDTAEAKALPVHVKDYPNGMAKTKTKPAKSKPAKAAKTARKAPAKAKAASKPKTSAKVKAEPTKADKVKAKRERDAKAKRDKRAAAKAAPAIVESVAGEPAPVAAE